MVLTAALLLVGAAGAFLVFKAASSLFETLRHKKASSDMQAFVEACAFVDDEATFAANYALVQRSAPLLRRAFLSSDGKRLVGADGGDPRLASAVADVLGTLERVATVFYYATGDFTSNVEMIDARTAGVVIGAHDALAFAIGEL